MSTPSYAVSSNGSLDQLFTSSIQLERELLSFDFQNKAGKEYKKPKSSLDKFQKKLKEMGQDKKEKYKRQVTIEDMFSRSGSNLP